MIRIHLPNLCSADPTSFADLLYRSLSFLLALLLNLCCLRRTRLEEALFLFLFSAVLLLKVLLLEVLLVELLLLSILLLGDFQLEDLILEALL